MPKAYTKKDSLEIAFRGVLRSHLEDIGTLEDMQSVYVIEECALKTIVKELMKEVSIRIYIGGE